MKRVVSRLLGFDQEKRARRWLEAQGVCMVASNFTCRGGEIDLIGLDGDTLVAFEVRYRADSRHGSAAESITHRKIERLTRCFEHFLQRHPRYANHPLRLDAVVIDGDGEPVWIRNIGGF